MARGFRLSGDNELAALQQSMRSRMRGDEARHRTQFAPSEPRSVAGHSYPPALSGSVAKRLAAQGQLGNRLAVMANAVNVADAAPSGRARVDAATITVPWPPSGNHAVKHANGSHYLRKEVLDYRKQVAELCIGAKRITGPYRLKVVFSPPDKRARDMDNALKSLLDALVPAGFLPSDSMTYMRELYACVVDKRAGIVQVTAESI